MTVISRRVLVPIDGKSDLALERAKRLVAILAKHGAAVRACKVVMGDAVGSIEILAQYPDFTAGSKVSAALAADPEMMKLWQEREKEPGASVAGPYVYRTVFRETSAMPVLLQREYQIRRQNLSEALKLLPEAFEATDKKPMTAVIPVFAPEMERLVVVYYAESLEAMGRNLDQFGMSEAFQAVVQKASRHGQLLSGRVLVQV